MSPKKQEPFSKIIQAALDDNIPFPPRYLYRLSDLNDEELDAFQKAWPKISVRRRQAILEDLSDFSQDDMLLNYYEIGLLGVKDSEPQTRLLAVHLLNEYEDIELVEIYLDLLNHDGEMPVRAAAANALGWFVYMAELEELSPHIAEEIETTLLRIHNSQEAKLVRQRALESLGFSSRPEVAELISAAFHSADQDWQASALLAMGRSYDSAFAPQVFDGLQDSHPGVRLEAVRAAGELELEDALPRLFELLQDPEHDIHKAAVWSLSQIGGNQVRPVLEQLLDVTEDEDESDLLETALENLEFTEGFQNLDFIDFEDDGSELDELDLLIPEDDEDDDEEEK
jgi:HEAT repeat protein